MSIGKWQPRTVDLLAMTFTFGYFTIFILLIFKAPPPENQTMLNVLFGVLTAIMYKIADTYLVKDAANSATATAIRAMKAEATQGDKI